MKTLRNALITGTLFVLFFMGCTQRSTTHLTYYETQCADAYSHGTNDTEHIINVNQYLTTHGINAANIELNVDSDSVMVCLACQCLSGIAVTIEIDETDVADAQALGFH